MLPMLLRIRIRDDKTSFGLFIPLIFVYLLMLPLYLLFSLVYGVVLLCTSPKAQTRLYMGLVFKLPLLLAAARGTEINVHSDKSKVILYIK